MTSTAPSVFVSSSTRLAGVALVCGASQQFAAVPLDGSAVVTEGSSLREVARGQPIVTDTPGPAKAALLLAAIFPLPEVWDVLELAGLLLPRCPTDSLDHVGAYLGLEPPDDDGLEARARLVRDVFEVLLQQVEAVGATTLLHVNRLAAGLEWSLGGLFRALEHGRPHSVLEETALAQAAPVGVWIAQGAGPRKRQQQQEPEPEALPLLLDDLERRFAPESALARAVPGYEPRPEQVEMARLVGETLNTSGQLLVEAGTGTGKSLAYLIPAALQAVQSHRRVVVSTATTTLQDQLFEQDVPLVQAALSGEQTVRATVLKGRSNYLCVRRWQALMHASDLSADDRSLLIRTLFWLPRTQTGDRAELRLSPGEEESWARVAAVTEACTPTRCPYHKIGVCFLARARRAAEDSHIIITNHALLLSDLVSRSRILPDYHVLIVDEAHHLEDEATAQLGWRIGERELLNRLDRLWAGATGVIPEALAVISSAHGLQVPAELLPELAQGEQAVIEARTLLQQVFACLSRLLEDPELGARGRETTLRIGGALRAGSAWQELEGLWLAAAEHINGIERTAALIADYVGEVPSARDAARELQSELGGQIEFWRDVRRRFARLLQPPGPAAVYWIAASGRRRWPTLNAAPLEVATTLRDRLFSAPEATILVSATLAINGSFDYVKRRLGLDDAAAAALGSPFDYASAALLYVPNDVPDPTQLGYQSVIERTIVDAVTRLRGRTLVLFTNRVQLMETYQALHATLARQRITLLGQGIDESSRTRLLEAFRRGSRVALFGTNAFWEGIDVVGDALSCVIVTRLPFSVPTDPIYAARAEQFDEPFMQYAMPQAVLRLKQGFGRLIRSRSDRGAVVVLDRRLVTRFYGEVFVRSLPSCTLKQGPARRTGAEVGAWLDVPAAIQAELAL